MDVVQMQSLSRSLAMQQCSEIIRLQEEVCCRLQRKMSLSYTVSREDYQELIRNLESEKVSHQRTMQLLEQERERGRLAEAELRVLRRQLRREKTTFENAFGLLKSQALTDSSNTEELLARCAALECVKNQKDEELASQEQLMRELQRRLRAEEERHKKELMEARVRAQQEAYLARHLGERQSRPTKRNRKENTKL